ncbi:MAG: hypothetical protein R3C16_03585 [Hyphomonadaceae bacterium]
MRMAQGESADPLHYERACAVFTAVTDEHLRALVAEYLDLNQNRFGGIMVRTLDYDDAILPLREGEVREFRPRLRAGVPYRFIGACDNECRDIDLLVASADGAPIQRDLLTDNFPVVDVTPEADGEYIVQMYLHACAIEPCYAGLRILEQRNNWALQPYVGTLALTSGAFGDPTYVDLQAGGDVDMYRRQSSCGGFVSERPDVRVNFTAAEDGPPLIFSLHSAQDTTLVINGPDGLWYCDDDSGVLGFNPMVLFEHPQSGQYDIWAGVYAEENELHPARLAISERTSQ